MLLIIHQNNKPINVYKNGKALEFKSKDLPQLVFEFAKRFPTELIIWCHKNLQTSLNISELETIFRHPLLMASFSTSKTFIISDDIGYVEQSSPFIKINFDVTYPTWRMSSDVGGIHSEVLNLMIDKIDATSNFEYFLNSLAKLAMPNGLFCYSEPKLLKKGCPVLTNKKQSKFTLFKFVRQHYKLSWLAVLVFNYLIYEQKIAILQFLKAFFYKNKTTKIDFSSIKTSSAAKTPSLFNVDVVIPTIGRKKYLYDVLLDLNKQTIFPKNVIIVEQNPKKSSTSALDYLQSESWKFNIIHKFIHQTGACNARNIALQNVTSNWVFFADDDIRIPSDFIENVFKKTEKLKANALTVSCLKEDETEKFDFLFQWATFGSGCSVVNMAKAKNCKFDMAFEHGFGEDGDFGMQLRNQGIDVIYAPTIKLTHLKAPIGGFRTKHVHSWENEKVLPKPSPTIMLYNEKHHTKKQLLGYKTLLFAKFYRLQEIKNPFEYLKSMRKRWKISKKWSQQLRNQSNEI